MKKLLLLPLLLASCAPMAAGPGPLASGDVLTMTGTTKDKETVSVTLTVRGAGERDRDGDWDYDADGTQPRSALISVNREQDFVAAVEAPRLAGVGGAQGDKILACFADASGPGWRTAQGYLIQETETGFKALIDRAKAQSSSAQRLRTFVENAGECQITRK